MQDNKLQFSDIWEAYNRISPLICKTPLEKSIYLSNEKQNVFMKLECQQPIKAFKIRGAFNKILKLSEEELDKGVAAISSGNHGIAVSYVAKFLGIKQAIIIVPENTPKSKIDKIKFYGGKVILMGQCFDDAHREGMKFIKNKGYVYIDGWDNDIDIYAGQGTVGLEIMMQNSDIDTILAPIGGGGLCISSAVAAKRIKPDIKVFGICTESCTAWPDSVRDKTLYHEYLNQDSVCEAMVGGIGKLSFRMRDMLDGCFIIKERMIKKAMMHAVLNEKIVAEAAGAVPIAAMMQYGLEIPGQNIALIISGGNVNNDVLVQEINKNKLIQSNT